MFGTIRTLVPVRCPSGHDFTQDILTAVDVDRDPDLLTLLQSDGGQSAECPVCARSWMLAEPVAISSPSEGWLALMIPDALLHRVLDLKTTTLRALKELPPALLTDAVVQFRTLTRAEVDRLLDGGPAKAAAGRTESPGIARAFADLVSIVPPPKNGM